MSTVACNMFATTAVTDTITWISGNILIWRRCYKLSKWRN